MNKPEEEAPGFFMSILNKRHSFCIIWYTKNRNRKMSTLWIVVLGIILTCMFLLLLLRGIAWLLVWQDKKEMKKWRETLHRGQTISFFNENQKVFMSGKIIHNISKDSKKIKVQTNRRITPMVISRDTIYPNNYDLR